MSVYGRYVLPTLTDIAMGNRVLTRDRARWVPRAWGIVLEIGAGSGRNAPHYGPAVEKLFALEPSEPLRRRARERFAPRPFAVEFLSSAAEAIPLGDGAVDSVVSTWTLCSIDDPVRALGEVRRVLRAGGRLIFIEHGRAPDRTVAAWQDRLTPVWRCVAGGCRLNRPVAELLTGSGFTIEALDASYAPGLRVASYFYRGVARDSAEGGSQWPPGGA